MKLFSKKALALVLTLAMLMSCAVFSFGADAALSGVQMRNDYEDGDPTNADNWASKYTDANVGPFSNTASNYARLYEESDGNHAMMVGFGSGGEGYMSGYWFQSKAGNYHDGKAGSWSMYGNGKYMVKLRYKVLSINQSTGAQFAIRFGMAKNGYFYYESGGKFANKSVGNFTNASGPCGVYTDVVVIDQSDVNAGWQEAVGYLDVTNATGNNLKAHIFASIGGGYQDAASGTEILIDDVYIYSYDSAADIATPDARLTATKMWENDFSNPTSSNWGTMLVAGLNANASYHPNFHSDSSKSTAGNYATLENGYMKVGFPSESSEGYVSAFALKHQFNTVASSGIFYGAGGNEPNYSKTGYFSPVAGTYAIKFDYKVTSFNAASASKVALNLARGKSSGLDGNRTNSVFAGYDTMMTLDASDVSTEWKTKVAFVTLPAGITTSNLGGLFISASVVDNTAADQTNFEILVDNFEIYNYTTLPKATIKYNGNTVGSVDALPGYPVSLPAADALSMSIPDGYAAAYYADEACTTPADAVICGNTGAEVYVGLTKLPKKALYENTFSAPTDSNWGKYLNKASGWISKGSITTTTYLADEKAMELTLTGAAANGAGNDYYTAGFQMFNEAADVGSFTVPAGYYVVQFDYKVTDFTAEADAALDIMATFAKTYYWDGSDNPPKNKLMKDGFNNDKSPVSGVAATVTASDKGGDWVTVTKLFTLEGTVDRNLHIHIKAKNGFTGSMADTKVLIDNVKLYQYDINFDQSVNDRTAYLYKGNAGTAEEPNWTNLHSYVGNTAKEGIYTSLRLAAKYTAGDSTGNTIIIDGVEYELAERGILVGVEGSELDLNNRPTYKWKASKTENFDQYWTPNPVVESDEPIEISYTLRLANMGEAWFTDTTKYQFRSYYKVKAPDFESDEGFLIYGGISEAKTFGEMADTFTKTENWFPGLS